MSTSTTPEHNVRPVVPQAAFGFRCIACGLASDVAGQDFRCAHCADLIEIIYPQWGESDKKLAPQPDRLKSIWKQRQLSPTQADLSGVWRFRELLPALAREENIITLREGNTPLYELPQCSRITGIPRLLAKHQGMNPTGSFKDTGMTVAASFARQADFRWVACASTGNTSASMAAYAARGGLRALVLVPDGKISWSKLSQALDYGAVTCQLRTDFDG
jgi:threonine synthase